MAMFSSNEALTQMPKSEFVFEACVDSVYSALQAEKGGAGRLELCSGLSEGGLTPSYGLIKTVKDAVRIPIHVLIRPRGGDFCYITSEIDVILEDVKMVGKMGVQGIAFGALTLDGNVDMQLMKTVIEACKEWNLRITFHRAFDDARDPLNALEDLMELGVSRLLTSGQKPSVSEALPFLETVISCTSGKMIIIPAGGIKASNAAHIVQTLGVKELHGTAAEPLSHGMNFHNKDIVNFMSGGRIPMGTSYKEVSMIVQTCNQ